MHYIRSYSKRTKMVTFIKTTYNELSRCFQNFSSLKSNQPVTLNQINFYNNFKCNSIMKLTHTTF